jgi:hypothetical protein
MAIFVGTRLGLRPNLLPVVLSVSLLLAGCGVVGVGMQSTTAVPIFTSSPGTTATQDSTYTYQIATKPAVGAVTLALASSPSGATLSGNTLTWTPSAGQSRMPDQFTVTATTSGGSATQSWIVTPTGTVSGTWVDTNWTPSGAVLMPFDFTKAPVPPSALVPQPDGSFQTVLGTGKSDGTFTIPNIPGGYYWLRPAASASYWTSSSIFDFGADQNFQPPKATPTVTTTTLQLNFSGLDPLQAHDEIEFIPFPSAPFFAMFDASSPVGATSLSEGALINSNLDFSQVDTGFMLQYEPETVGALNTLSLSSEATVSNVVVTNGAINTITGTLAHAPQVSFDLNIKGSAWVPLFDNVGPGAATPSVSNLALLAQPFVNDSNLFANSGLSLSLLFGPQPTPFILASSHCIIYGPSNSTGFFGGQPGEPPVVTDQDFGIVQYGDPFPSAWPRLFTFCQSFSVNVPLPGSGSSVTFDLIDTQSTLPPTSQVSPLVSQVQEPIINSSNLFAANTVGATGVTLSWTAPVVGTPTGYKIDTFVAGVPPNGVLTYVPAGTFYTAKTSATLPPLQAGKTYVFLISAILDGRANFETSPNRSALPTASASVVSAPITITAGP